MTGETKPPAYQEYAANLLADRRFRLMTLAERGLFHTMRHECWVNENVPANPDDLAKYLGLDAVELNKALTPNVMAYFEKRNSDLICPAIELYRLELNDRRKRQSEGGKKAAQKVNARHQLNDSSYSQVAGQVTRESLVQNRIEQNSKEQSLASDDIKPFKDEWIDAYNDADADEPIPF